jgi:hypothetical protein
VDSLIVALTTHQALLVVEIHHHVMPFISYWLRRLFYTTGEVLHPVDPIATKERWLSMPSNFHFLYQEEPNDGNVPYIVSSHRFFMFEFTFAN